MGSENWKGRDKFFEAVEAERTVQDSIWGGRTHDQDHTQRDWWGLLQERVHMINKAVKEDEEGDLTAQVRYRRHLIELAALACAAFEVDE